MATNWSSKSYRPRLSSAFIMYQAVGVQVKHAWRGSLNLIEHWMPTMPYLLAKTTSHYYRTIQAIVLEHTLSSLSSGGDERVLSLLSPTSASLIVRTSEVFLSSIAKAMSSLPFTPCFLSSPQRVKIRLCASVKHEAIYNAELYN